jgi:hypothetical protein
VSNHDLHSSANEDKDDSDLSVPDTEADLEEGLRDILSLAGVDLEGLDDIDDNGEDDFCPETWDGFSCVDATPAGQEAYVTCPTYLEQSQASGKSCVLFAEKSKFLYLNSVSLPV